MKSIIQMPPTAELRRIFSLDEDTGELTYRISPMGSVRPGAIAGRIGGSGYRDVCISGRRYRAHRVIFKMVHNREPRGFVDHIDGNRLNNRPSNLREATHSENQRNGGAYRNNTTGFKGVIFHKRDRVFEAWIRADGRQNYLGRFLTAEAAHAAYCEAATRLHGEFARVA